MLESLVVAAVLALVGCAMMTWLASPRRRAGLPADSGGDAGQARPATVNLVVTKCSPGAAAYQATILDLAARGFLAASSQPGHLWLTLAVQQAAPGVLADYEQQVLGDMRARMADTGGAPFMALAEACTADVRGTWDPFEKKLLADARRRGICRQPLPATGRNVLLALAATAAIAAVAFVVGSPHPAGAAGGPVFTPLIAVIVFWCGLGWLERQDRLTAAGSALAARWKREKADLATAAAWEDAAPAALEQRAFAVAAGVRRAAPGPPVPYGGHPGGRPRNARRVHAGPPSPADRPADAWSSFSGTWRLVPAGPGEGMGMGAGVAMLAAAGWLGIIAYAISIPGGTGPFPLAVGGVAAGVGGFGLRRLLRLSALPARATFDGQVIARWEEDTDSENGAGQREPHVLVDDGQRGWTFSGSGVFNRVALGDLVRVTVNPRSRKLLDLAVTGRPRG